MNDSILNDIKKMLGLNEEYDHFDQDIIIHINAALSTLIQIGLPANKSFVLSSKEQTWSDFINNGNETIDQTPLATAFALVRTASVNNSSNMNIGMIKSYVYMKVKLIFDPPGNSFAIDSMNKIISEYESRINIEYDTTE